MHEWQSSSCSPMAVDTEKSLCTHTHSLVCVIITAETELGIQQANLLSCVDWLILTNVPSSLIQFKLGRIFWSVPETEIQVHGWSVLLRRCPLCQRWRGAWQPRSTPCQSSSRSGPSFQFPSFGKENEPSKWRNAQFKLCTSCESLHLRIQCYFVVLCSQRWSCTHPHTVWSPVQSEPNSYTGWLCCWHLCYPLVKRMQTRKCPCTVSLKVDI